jgi:hypothetical protein
MAVENRIEHELHYEFFDRVFRAHAGLAGDVAETVGSAFIAAVDEPDDERRDRMRAHIATYVWKHDGAEDWLAVADIIRRQRALHAEARRKD